MTKVNTSMEKLVHNIYEMVQLKKCQVCNKNDGYCMRSDSDFGYILYWLAILSPQNMVYGFFGLKFKDFLP